MLLRGTNHVGLQRARAHLNQGRTTAHRALPAHTSARSVAGARGFFRPDRYTDDASAAAALKVDGKARFFELLRYVEGRLPDSGFVLGQRYSLVDAYLSVFFLRRGASSYL